MLPVLSSAFTPRATPSDSGGALLRQLSVSPPLAGAHPHYHGATFNILVAGVRRWSLRPPASSTFRLQPALHHFYWLRHGKQHPRADEAHSSPHRVAGTAVGGGSRRGGSRRGGNRRGDQWQSKTEAALGSDGGRVTEGGAEEEARGSWVDVVQRAGEVLYLPPDWQHTTLSLSESVAVAVEFV